MKNHQGISYTVICKQSNSTNSVMTNS